MHHHHHHHRLNVIFIPQTLTIYMQIFTYRLRLPKKNVCQFMMIRNVFVNYLNVENDIYRGCVCVCATLNTCETRLIWLHNICKQIHFFINSKHLWPYCNASVITSYTVSETNERTYCLQWEWVNPNRLMFDNTNEMKIIFSFFLHKNWYYLLELN